MTMMNGEDGSDRKKIKTAVLSVLKMLAAN
jgi:hypothetical protein